MTVLNKTVLAAHLHKRLGISKRDALDAANIIFEEMSDCLAEEGYIRIDKFGVFAINEKNRKPVFIPSLDLIRKCRENKDEKLGEI